MEGSSVEQSLARFREEFADERTCAAYLRKMRWPDGFACLCGSRRAWLLNSRAHTYECRDCHHQTSITSGTLLQKSSVPLTRWFWAAHLIAINSDAMSVRQFQKLCDVSFSSARRLMRKLQPLKEAAESERVVEPLEGLVEVGQTELPSRAYYPSSGREESIKIVVAGAVEVTPVGEEVPFRHARPPRLATIRDSSASSIESFVRAHVRPGASVITDGRKSYRGLTDYCLDPQAFGERLRTISRVFASMRAWFRKADYLSPDTVDETLKFFVVREYQHSCLQVSFEALLGLALHPKPTTDGDISDYTNPWKGNPTIRRNPRRRKTATGMREDGGGLAQDRVTLFR